MKCVFIYNPASGNGRIVKHLDFIQKTLKEKFDVVDLYESKSRDDTIEQAKAFSCQYDALIFSGGDGTFNDITCGVATCEKRPILGYIPSGTVNDIARNLLIPRNIRRALKIITDGAITTHDVGMINNRYFMYVCATGTFSNVSYRTKQKTKKIFGRLAYGLDGIKEIVNPTMTKAKIITETETVEMVVPLMLILNSINVGGIPFNRYGHLNDGLFDIVLVKKDVMKGLINILTLFTFGIGIKRITNRFLCLKSARFKIEVGDDITWCVDGEAGPKGSIEIVNIHNHLRIYVPKKKMIVKK